MDQLGKAMGGNPTRETLGMDSLRWNAWRLPRCGVKRVQESAGQVTGRWGAHHGALPHVYM